jgi:chromosome segregation ATPase
MPNIPDDFGRIGKFGSAEFEELKKALNTAVGDAVKFGAESSKKSDVKDDNNIEKLIEAISEATKIFSDTQEDIKENIESTKKFVEEVKTATDELGKERVSKKAPAVSVGDNLQSAQQTILKNKQKATQDKINQYTSGATALKTSVSVDAGSFQRASGSLPSVGASSIRENKEAAEGILGTVARMFTLEKLGFRKKGVDRVPAMLQSGELVVSKKEAEGYKNGGFVKPQYLARSEAFLLVH